VEAGRLPARGATLAVTVAGDGAILAEGPDGLRLLDLGGPAVAVLAAVELPGRLHADRVALEGTTVFVATTLDRFAIVDIEVPREPRVLWPRARRMRVTMP
jgi:hypothetical protein